MIEAMVALADRQPLFQQAIERAERTPGSNPLLELMHMTGQPASAAAKASAPPKPMPPSFSGLAAERVDRWCKQCVPHRILNGDDEFIGCRLLRGCKMNLPKFLNDPLVRCPWPEGWPERARMKEEGDAG